MRKIVVLTLAAGTLALAIALVGAVDRRVEEEEEAAIREVVERAYVQGIHGAPCPMP